MPESSPRVRVQIVVFNGSRFIRHCLDAVRSQTYSNKEVVILDNASTDSTPDIISRDYPEFTLIRNAANVGMWPGQELLLVNASCEYVLPLSVDVILDRNFITEAVSASEADTSIDAVQGRFYQYDITELERGGTRALTKNIIDTCGFGITRSRKVLNIGHGQPDGPQFEGIRAIFGAEGAAPFYRRRALESCRVNGLLIDHDYFWYGDDLDLAWRMTLLGHRQVYVPAVIAWHDRSTTKGAAATLKGHVDRLGIRRLIPLRKRRLDWSNVRFTIIKNDYIMNVLRDFPWILLREAATLIYTLAFEPKVLAEAGRFFSLLPRMIVRRRDVMRRAVMSPAEMHHWFHDTI